MKQTSTIRGWAVEYETRTPALALRVLDLVQWAGILSCTILWIVVTKKLKICTLGPAFCRWNARDFVTQFCRYVLENGVMAIFITILPFFVAENP